MRVATTILLISIILESSAFAGGYLIDPYDYPIVKLYEKATTYSKEIYKIPIEVKLLDFKEDMTWFKVKIKFSLGPINFDYSGWTKIPLGDLAAKKAAAKKRRLP